MYPEHVPPPRKGQVGCEGFPRVMRSRCSCRRPHRGDRRFAFESRDTPFLGVALRYDFESCDLILRVAMRF
eukprot:957987-Prorocentrum_minimum.AAC.1